MKKTILLLLIIIHFFGCKLEQKPLYLPEKEVLPIKISGPLSERKSEISSLAWYNDYLIILPQYPERFLENNVPSLFAITKKQLNEYLNSKTKTEIKPITIPFYIPDLSDIEGYEGFEALTFIDNEIFLTIESSPNKMLGYIIKGKISPTLSKIEISNKKVKIKPQSDIPNACYETIIAYDNKLITIYEANGKNVNPHPKAIVFNTNLEKIDEIDFPNIEYRITDATSIKNGKFYAINYFWPGDEEYYIPAEDILKEKWGYGKTHSENNNVERIVEFEIVKNEISFTNIAPIYLKLLGQNKARNWEGIVRYNSGFIIATDKYPYTIIGYIKN